METMMELYRRILKQKLRHSADADLENLSLRPDDFQLDCLLHPDRHAPVWVEGDACCNCDNPACVKSCFFDAIHQTQEGKLEVDKEKCTGCNACIEACHSHKLLESKEAVAMLESLEQGDKPIYVMIAPAFIGQFSDRVTPGKLRAAFKRLGFTGMVEVALFADILTLKEALEFDHMIQHDGDFMLTSCCCPMWIAMIRRVYKDLVPHIPPAVSPMVACGRSIKKMHPGAVTVFIGPCLAKKAEAKEKDIADAVDFVLTFQEIAQVFEMAGIDPADEQEDSRDHSSRAGRIYAYTGGVSEAVRSTVDQLNPNRKIKLKSAQADGVPACKKILQDLQSNQLQANFIEGMGCKGGCVGGPRAFIDKEEGKAGVERYGEEAQYRTPLDNPYVLELLEQLGIQTVEQLRKHSDIFTREL